MKLAIGSNYDGFELKQVLAARLREAGHEVVDVSPQADPDCRIDQAPIAVAKLVADAAVEGGILVDESGAASAIVANKMRGIRAAQVGDLYSARLTKAHNDANILCFGSQVVGQYVAWNCVQIWMQTQVMGGNHPLRLDMIRQLEDLYEK
jgi:ribose 5-phosphate isomerase B